MSFVPNSYQQISLFDKLAFLSQRKQRMLEKSWAQAFSNHIFTRINEHIFAPLYSEKMNSRPNAPINVLVGALILKDFTNLPTSQIKSSQRPASLISGISTRFIPQVLKTSLSVNGH